MKVLAFRQDTYANDVNPAFQCETTFSMWKKPDVFVPTPTSLWIKLWILWKCISLLGQDSNVPHIIFTLVRLFKGRMIRFAATYTNCGKHETSCDE
jgi:hypothetical protein